MIIPMNFVIGAAVGVVTTYVLKDDTTKQWVKDKGGKLKNMVTFKKKAKEEAEPAVKSGEVIEGSAKDVSDQKGAAA